MLVNSRGGRNPRNFDGRCAPDDRRDVLVGGAVALHERDELLVQPLLALVPRQPGGQPLGDRQAHRAFHLLHQIAGKADVIDVRVGQCEVLQRTAAQQPAPQLVPDLKDIVGVHAAVDQRPARPVVEQPAVDVIETKRHRQPHPVEAGQDVGQLAIGRRPLHGEAEIFVEAVALRHVPRPPLSRRPGHILRDAPPSPFRLRRGSSG